MNDIERKEVIQECTMLVEYGERSINDHYEKRNIINERIIRLLDKLEIILNGCTTR